MPPRHAYWTILIDDQPTAFRAHDAEELLPTLNRLREKNPTAAMKWFERGKLFDSRDQAREAGLGQGERRWEGPRPNRDQDSPGRDQARAPKDKNWRPGGEHRDPRQKYKDAKKAKWNRFKDTIRQRQEERGSQNPESFTPPHGDKLRQPDRRPSTARPPSDRRPPWRDDRGERGERSRDRRSPTSSGHRPAAKPPADKLSARPRAPEWRRDDDRRGGQRDGDRNPRPWSDRPPRRESDRPERTWSDQPPRRDGEREQRPWRDRPRRENDRESRPRTDRPPRTEPWGGGASRTREDSRGWKPKGPAARRKPAGGSDRKPWSGQPAGSGERKPWTAKPPGGGKKSWSSKASGRPPGGGRPPKRRRDDE